MVVERTGMSDLDHVREEFARQADRFGSAAATTRSDLTRRIVDAVPAEGIVLDLACGPGIVSAALAPKARQIVGLDLTPQMLANARRRCTSAGLGNVAFVEGSAGDLPFAAAAFDAVVTRLSIHHFGEPARVLDEMRRVLRPGGSLVLADVVSAADREKSALHNAIEILRDPSHVRMLPAAELLAVVGAAGFAIESQDGWDQPRELEEWLAIVDDPGRAAPLRPILRALAAAGEDAGIGLSLEDSAVRFIHRWLLIVAKRPA
jgi:ubiquinone/menaquinone biosynthesis C-methylase UbiE